MSLMREASEHGAPAYQLTVRGSVHINQSDFSILYGHITSGFMKATVNPERAIDLNISTSLEFLRLVTPDIGGGKSIIGRCMTDEQILQTPLMEETPNEHRPNDQWIAARLRVDNEFRTRMAAGIQRKFKRNLKGGTGAGYYTTSDEMWCFFKPSDEALKKWIDNEDRGEKRIDEPHATAHDNGVQQSSRPGAYEPELATSLSDAERDDKTLRSEDDSGSKNTPGGQTEREHSPEPVRDKFHDDEKSASVDGGQRRISAAAGPGEEAPANTWMGAIPPLR